MSTMGRDSDILQKSSTPKRTFSNDVTAKKSCQENKGKKSFQAHQYHIHSAFQEVNIHRSDNYERVTLEKLGSSFYRNLTKEEFSIFINHMTRVEWLASLGTLSATKDHELMQVLTVIRLSLDDILDGLKTASLSLETAIRDLNEVLVQVSNITSIIQRFQNLARKCPERVVNQIDLKLVAEKIVKVLSKSAKQKRIELHLKELDRLPSIYMNEREIEQLFFILVENAIQAADGGKDRKLCISGSVTKRGIELCFSDNCGGIAPEYLEEIFEPFFTIKPSGQGTGLGLYIAKMIVSRAGGGIRIKSEYGEGSTFLVTFPINDEQ